MVQFSEYVRKLAADKEKALAAAQEPENRLPSEFGESVSAMNLAVVVFVTQSCWFDSRTFVRMSGSRIW